MSVCPQQRRTGLLLGFVSGGKRGEKMEGEGGRGVGGKEGGREGVKGWFQSPYFFPWRPTWMSAGSSLDAEFSEERMDL